MTHSSFLKVAFAAAALISICTSAASAKEESWYRQNAQVDYSGYQNPQGQYDSPADFTRSVEGTPCGIECTQQHEEAWGHQQR